MLLFFPFCFARFLRNKSRPKPYPFSLFGFCHFFPLIWPCYPQSAIRLPNVCPRLFSPFSPGGVCLSATFFSITFDAVFGPPISLIPPPPLPDFPLNHTCRLSLHAALDAVGIDRPPSFFSMRSPRNTLFAFFFFHAAIPAKSGFEDPAAWFFVFFWVGVGGPAFPRRVHPFVWISLSQRI